eukprot:16437346-Heterocapsa_arctica.AAC.1
MPWSRSGLLGRGGGGNPLTLRDLKGEGPAQVALSHLGPDPGPVGGDSGGLRTPLQERLEVLAGVGFCGVHAPMVPRANIPDGVEPGDGEGEPVLGIQRFLGAQGGRLWRGSGGRNRKQRKDRV